MLLATSVTIKEMDAEHPTPSTLNPVFFFFITLEPGVE